MRLLSLLATAILFPFAYSFCPKLFNNQTACSCDTTVEGPIIKCTGMEGLTMVDKLKASHMEIKEFILENANIIEIGPRAFKNLRIKKLSLAKNRIQDIHEHAFKGLENVMQELSIAENNLKNIPTRALTGLRVLNTLSLQCNKISNIKSNSLVNMTSLIDLNLACNEICEMDSHAFENVKNSLQNLILDSNCFEKLPSSTIQNMNNLIALHMKYNKIKKLLPNDFTNLTSLSMLSLNGNQIGSVSGGVFQNTPNLRYLYLNENNLTTFDSGVMRQLKQVQVLDLSYNNISDVTKEMFEGLESVQHLNLDSNRITSIAPGAFSGTPLLLLWLPNNCLKEITPHTLQGAPFLRMVSFSNNNIKSVEDLSFAHLANLHTLDLANNRIVSLQNKSLSGAENLAVRLQENPMVCTKNGFHVLNAGEAINLTNEENLICKQEWRTEMEDSCPKQHPISRNSQCCSRKTTELTLADSLAADSTTTMSAVLTSKNNFKNDGLEQNNVTIAKKEKTVHLLLPTESPKLMKTVNMERFWRLSQRPSKPSPFMRHAQKSQPKFLQTSTAMMPEEASENFEESSESEYIEDDEENDNDEYHQEKNNRSTHTANETSEQKNDAKLPVRLRERQKMLSGDMPPWMIHSRTVEDSFNIDERVETTFEDEKIVETN